MEDFGDLIKCQLSGIRTALSTALFIPSGNWHSVNHAPHTIVAAAEPCADRITALLNPYKTPTQTVLTRVNAAVTVMTKLVFVITFTYQKQLTWKCAVILWHQWCALDLYDCWVSPLIVQSHLTSKLIILPVTYVPNHSSIITQSLAVSVATADYVWNAIKDAIQQVPVPLTQLQQYFVVQQLPSIKEAQFTCCCPNMESAVQHPCFICPGAIIYMLFQTIFIQTL